MFAALANRNYRIYVSGSFVSNVGTWMQRVAQDWLVLELSGGSGLAGGITTGLQFLPMLLLSPYGGVGAGRFDKRGGLQLTPARPGPSGGGPRGLPATRGAGPRPAHPVPFPFG